MEKTTHKATLRIPTKEHYSYIELQVEGEADYIIETYLNFTELYKKKLKEKEAEQPPF